jgi:formylglycine-generating enzyme
MSSTFGPLSTTRYVVNGVAFDTIRVPPGRFVDGEGWVKRTLLVSRPFEIGMTLVTQALWRAVMGASPSHIQGDDLPVEQVSWNDTQAFLGRLETLGLRGFRLPTEAEWAWAARCGAPTRLAGADRVEPVAVAGRGKPWPVGHLRPSAVGALDLSGGLWEWQHDAWSYPPVMGVDVQDSSWRPLRVRRGDSWRSGPRGVRVADRDRDHAGDRNDDLGIRLARTRS